MAIINEEHKIVYYSIPKVACSSQKLAHYRLLHGKPFAREDTGGKGIHDIYGSPKFDLGEHRVLRKAGYWSYAIVRDPIERLISAYANKVIDADVITVRAAKEKSALKRLEANGLPSKPDLETFALNLETYRRICPEIRQHTRHYHYFLGRNLKVFSVIFPIEDMQKLRRALSRRTGQTQPVRHTNKSGSKELLTQMSETAFEAFLEFSEPDYKLLTEFYKRPDFWKYQLEELTS